MAATVLLYQLGLLASVAITLVALRIAWQHRDNRGGLALVVLLGSAATWSASVFVSSLWPGAHLAILVGNVGYISVTLVVPSLFAFVLAYTGRTKYPTRRTIAALAVEPIALTALIWTNDAHRLIWTAVGTDGEALDGISRTMGPVFPIHTLYSYVLLVIAIALLVVFAVRSRYRYRRQVAAVVVAALVPWMANAAYHVVDLPADPTAIAFTVTAIAFTWAVVREDFLSVTPVTTQIVLDTIETAVFVVDTTDRLVEYNARASELLGFAGEDRVGTDVRSVIDDPAILDTYDEMVGHRSPAQREFEAADRYLRLQSSPLIERNDDLVGHVFLVVDLTEQREREQELQRRNEQLDRFASVVSHDLRSPLQVASASVELARETDGGDHLDRAERAHERMETLVENLLTLARGNDAIQRDPVDVTSTAETAWSFVETAEATLATDCSLTIQADPDRLQQLFENLFRNAVEHGSSGESPGNSSLQVRVEALSDPSGFAVTDDGPGFDPDAVEDIFEMGYSTESSGIGYGLSIVSHIVEQHGWSITATNAPDGGARIEIRTDL
ncbi:sensor histidine kinase [Halorhabdus salina]|uniref:sensor histidine kinase n=1 Tax=Halorhabdus salina TaxID=2750670 RepID=UPI0015EEFF19|nr:histidine kinase N-terminal 7TM domain-containing protein [Halorhabdus salina]